MRKEVLLSASHSSEMVLNQIKPEVSMLFFIFFYFVCHVLSKITLRQKENVITVFILEMNVLQ